MCGSKILKVDKLILKLKLMKKKCIDKKKKIVDNSYSDEKEKEKEVVIDN